MQNNINTKFLIILILYFNTFFIWKILKSQKSPEFSKYHKSHKSFKYNETFEKNATKEENFEQKPKLYDSLKNPFLLIILDFENLNLNEDKISNLISISLILLFLEILHIHQ